jgi:hypothetical protein
MQNVMNRRWLLQKVCRPRTTGSWINSRCRILARAKSSSKQSGYSRYWERHEAPFALRPPGSWFCAGKAQSGLPAAQAQCSPRSVGFRHALNTSTQLHQNSDHGGTCVINAWRRSASRRHWSRLSMSRLTEAERNSSVLRASRSIARSCSTSTRNTFISMSNSFSSRRMTGSGSGASHGWDSGNGVAR